MPRVQVTRSLHFNAAHRLFRPDWTDEENLRVFGPCSNPRWHGHNYEIEVTVSGEIDSETGFVIDLKTLAGIVSDRLLADLDHKNLNEEVPWLSGINPTAENLVVAMWNRLGPVLPDGVTLKRLVLQETPRNRAEYDGE